MSAYVTLNKKRPFGAVLTAMVTPFTSDLAVDYDACGRIARHLVDSGCAGIVLNGTTGEAPTTSTDEKLRIIETVRDEVGDEVCLLAGVGSYNTTADIPVVQATTQLVDGLLMLPPFYSKPTPDGIRAHYLALLEAATKPVMIYDIPGRVGVPVPTELLIELAAHPLVVAVKDAKDDLFASSQVMAATDLAYYSGSDQLNLAHIGQGAAGFVSVIGHAVGKELAEMVTLTDAGRLPQAVQVNHDLLDVITAMCTLVPGACAAKAALEALGVLDNRRVRMPMLEAPDHVADQIARALGRKA